MGKLFICGQVVTVANTGQDTTFKPWKSTNVTIVYKLIGPGELDLRNFKVLANELGEP